MEPERRRRSSSPAAPVRSGNGGNDDRYSEVSSIRASEVKSRASKSGVTSERAAAQLRDKVKNPKYVIKRLRVLLGDQARYGLPGTNGNFWNCFRAHMIQEHFLISLFAAHELHPFSRRERIPIFINYTCVQFFLATVFIQSRLPFYATSFLIAAMSSVYLKIIRSFVEVRCCIGCDGPEKFCRCCGRFMTGWLTLMSFGLAALGIIFAIRQASQPRHTDEWFVPLWIGAQSLSVLFVDPFVLFYLQLISWREERRKFQEKFGSLFPDDDPPVSISQIGLFVPDRSPRFSLHLRLGPDTTGKYTLHYFEWLIAPKQFWNRTPESRRAVILPHDHEDLEEKGDRGSTVSKGTTGRRDQMPSPTADDRKRSPRKERQALLRRVSTDPSQAATPVGTYGTTQTVPNHHIAPPSYSPASQDTQDSDRPVEPENRIETASKYDSRAGFQRPVPKTSASTEDRAVEIKARQKNQSHSNKTNQLWEQSNRNPIGAPPSFEDLEDAEGAGKPSKGDGKGRRRTQSHSNETNQLWEQSDTNPIGAPPSFEDQDAQASQITDGEGAKEPSKGGGGAMTQQRNMSFRNHPAIFVDSVEHNNRLRKIIYRPDGGVENRTLESDESFTMGEILDRGDENKEEQAAKLGGGFPATPPLTGEVGHQVSRAAALRRLRDAEAARGSAESKQHATLNTRYID